VSDYPVLDDFSEDGATHIVAANRRLARALQQAWADRQVAAGRAAWRTPAIHALSDWYPALAERVVADSEFPARINDLQSRVLWEQCLRSDIDDPFIRFPALARACRDAWQRLHDWCVPVVEVQEAARGQDQRWFARAAGAYADRLADGGWLDTATLPAAIVDRLRGAAAPALQEVRTCGFDRMPPRLQTVLEALAATGARISDAPMPAGRPRRFLRFANADGELRAAGAWARHALERAPSSRIAIVVTALERDAGRAASLIREGFVPGWQTASSRIAAAVELSYGRALGDYPAVATAMLVLRWLFHDIGSPDVGHLLRSPHIGSGLLAGRHRLDLALRDLPDRDWSRARLVDAVGAAADADGRDWIERVVRLDALLDPAITVRRPGEWAACFDAVLGELGWPGEASESSSDFQLANRWRKLLNEFARLELVVPRMSGVEAIGRIASMAGEVIFQPESDDGIVHVLGPLEAAGLAVDALWLTGATAADWPAGQRPLPLVSRELQRRYRMPDSTPELAAAHARQVLGRIAGMAADCTFSCAALDDDAEQMPTTLLGAGEILPSPDDPGWFAARFCGPDGVVGIEDRVPAVAPGEAIGGGAATLQKQAVEPLRAFVSGRLRASRLAPFVRGIAANTRGNLVHAALQALYRERPDRDALREWSDAERAGRIEASVRHAFARHERHADATLAAVLAVEKERTKRLLAAVLDTDAGRQPFRIAAVESRLDTGIGTLALRLRADRLDVLPDGGIAIIDYKTGQAKRFLKDGEPNDVQLVVYASALREPVAGLALFNVESRHCGFDGAGPAFGDGDGFAEDLVRWEQAVRVLAQGIAAGDVRINVRQGLRDSRPLAILSRAAEVLRDGD